MIQEITLINMGNKNVKVVNRVDLMIELDKLLKLAVKVVIMGNIMI